MNSNIVFFVKKDTHIISNIDEWILTKGVIHKSVLTVSKSESSTSFVNLFKQLLKNRKIKINENENEYLDFKKLVQFGFLGIKNENKKIVLIVERNAKKFFKNYLKDENLSIKALDEFITYDTLTSLIEEKNKDELNKITKEYKSKYENVNLFVVCSLYYENYLRGINKLTKLIDIPYNLGFYDNDNIFATRVIHGETGCYQCLEDQILQKFDGYIEDYVSKIDSENQLFNIKNYGILISIIKSEIEELNIYTDTELRGNVLHFYLPTYEYNFDKNRIQSNCSVCSTINNILFKEQNMKACNILTEVLGNDKH